MPSYDFHCPYHGRQTLVMTYAQKDTFEGACEVFETNEGWCGAPLTQVYTPPVAHFTGPGFTRRNTNTNGNAGIDHTDWRSSETWPGNPDKKVKVQKRMTHDDFRKKAI